MAFTQFVEKAFGVLKFAKTESWTFVQHAFQTKFRKRGTRKKVHIEMAW